MTIIAGLLYAIFSRLLGRYKGALLASLGLALYSLLVGAGPSVVRAAIMGGYLGSLARSGGARRVSTDRWY
jgi:predicted membrane metal-binding protein